MNSQEKSQFVCVCVCVCLEAGLYRNEMGCAFHSLCRLPWTASKDPTCAGDTHMWTRCTCPVHNKSGLHKIVEPITSVGSIAASRDTSFRNVFESIYVTFRQITVTLTMASVGSS